MIKNIYIIRQNGVVIYSKHFIDLKYDDDVLIGFFASVSNFSREALHIAIKFVDLGEDNKLILYEHEREKIITAAIVDSHDDYELIIKVLSNIIHDFIILFAPYYDSLDPREVEKIIESHIKRKTSYKTIHRYLLSWLFLLPFSIFITFFNLIITIYYIGLYFEEERVYTQEELISQVLPEAVIISSFIIIIVFIIPNIVSGYITLNRNFAFLNAGSFIIVVLLAYLLFAEPFFFYLILYYLPSAIFVSLVFAYIGYRLGLKSKIVKK